MEELVDTTENLLTIAEDEDSLHIANKEWNRIMNAASKTGYREGVEDGSNSVFQEGFDMGYMEAFKSAFILGKFKALTNSIPENIKHPTDINDILDKTRRGACYICTLESQKNEDEMKKPISQILSKQKMHSRQTVERLHEYFQPVMKQLNIDMLDVLEPETNVLESNENKDLEIQDV